MCPKLFEILSEDVLDLIVAEVAKDAELEELCEMRLVCRDLSYVLESKLFKAATINITRPQAQRQLRIMASGNGANARWTTHLKVQSLPRAVNRPQSTLLRKAIEGLRKLESARIQFQMVSNYDVILAVSQLPKLRSVQLLFETGWRDSAPLPPLEYLKGLHALELSNLPLSQRAVDVLRRTITISPELQSLNIHYHLSNINSTGNPDRHSSLEDLASVFADAVAAPTFVPALERLILRGRRITLSPACVPYLSALTDPQIEQCATAHAMDPAFWEALAEGRVRLQHLQLYPLSPSIVAYLKAYTGLKTLRLSGNGKDESSINKQLHMVEALYREIVPHQRETLRVLCTANLPTTVWELEAKNLKAILRCRNLETLAVKYRYDVGKGNIDLPITDLVTEVVKRLPKLAKVNIHLNEDVKFSESPPNLFPPPNLPNHVPPPPVPPPLQPLNSLPMPPVPSARGVGCCLPPPCHWPGYNLDLRARRTAQLVEEMRRVVVDPTALNLSLDIVFEDEKEARFVYDTATQQFVLSKLGSGGLT